MARRVVALSKKLEWLIFPFVQMLLKSFIYTLSNIFVAVLWQRLLILI